MVDIYIQDTGFVDPEYGVTETAFTVWSSASATEKKEGEFKASSSPIKLKINSINNGISINTKKTPSLNTFYSYSSQITTQPLVYTLQGQLIKPTNFKGTDVKDLAEFKTLMLCTLSKGHKDLYVKDTNTTVEPLMSLYYLIDLFGKTDTGNSDNYKHINISIDSISFNEGKSSISYSIQITIFPYIS